MGRPAKTLELHRLAGTRPEAANPYEIATPVASGRPKFPKRISREARQTFKRLVGDLEARGHCTPGDREMIRIFCVIEDRWRKALEEIAKHGEIIDYIFVGKNGEQIPRQKVNPYLAVATACEKNLFAILRTLGLSPVDRSKVKTTVVPKKEMSDEEALFESLMQSAPRVPIEPGVN